MLRAAIAAESALGKRVKAVLDSGALVSDEIVIALIEEQLTAAEAAGGAIFDGFPRTLAQAQALDMMLKGRDAAIDKVVRLKVDDAVLLHRITGRFAEAGRPDDNPETFKVRLDAYNRQTAPLLPYYQGQGKLWRSTAWPPWTRWRRRSTGRSQPEGGTGVRRTPEFKGDRYAAKSSVYDRNSSTSH